MPRPPSLLLQALALPGAAVLCAAAANALAAPERKLVWWVSPAPASAAPRPLPEPPASPPSAASPVPTPASRPAGKPHLQPQAQPQSQPGAALPPASVDPAAEARRRFPAQGGLAVRTIDSHEALEAFRLGAPFLDARRSAEFAEGHVAGAWSAPAWEAVLAERVTEFEARRATRPEDPIVLYCAGEACQDSHVLARHLTGLGYRNLLIYAGGYPDWTAQGRPTAQGARP